MADDNESDERLSLSRYYNTSQFRIDTWNDLKNVSHRLHRGSARDNDRNLAREILDYLAPTELYWAFPGDYAVQQLYRYLDAGEFSILDRVVTRCVGGLMSGLYRRKHIDLGVNGEQSPAEPGEDMDTEEERIRRRPYFEVLIVDDITLAQQNHQRDELVRISQLGEDMFTYQPVFVPSFEDALIGVLFNLDNGNRVPLEMGPWYDFREFGCHLGNVGL